MRRLLPRERRVDVCWGVFEHHFDNLRGSQGSHLFIPIRSGREFLVRVRAKAGANGARSRLPQAFSGTHGVPRTSEG